jgi:hypothetical protein
VDVFECKRKRSCFTRCGDDVDVIGHSTKADDRYSMQGSALSQPSEGNESLRVSLKEEALAARPLWDGMRKPGAITRARRATLMDLRPVWSSPACAS